MVSRTRLLRRARRTGALAATVGALTLAGGCASVGHRAPLTGDQWVDSVMATMSPRDKAAQLVWPMFYADYVPTSSKQWQQITDEVTKQHVGGFIVSVGSPMEMAQKLNDVQRMSTLPLLIGADLETGAGFRARGGWFLPNGIDLGGATMFPPQMAIGATRDTTIAHAMGRITAVEGRALGIHIAFAPVLDVNNNPANPVIGPRSFGEDPHLVAEMGRNVVHGIQDNGMVATGKHFPGHGDTDVNSHLGMPTITASRARLDSVELVPFKAAIAAGVTGIMTFHGHIPALDTNPIPATLSHPIMTGLLRHELGFKGLLVTDALDMNGVLASIKAPANAAKTMGNYGVAVTAVSIAEVAKEAIAAGADVLLMPSDVPTAIDGVVAGVQEGRYTQARVDESVRRVLELKARFHLEQQRFVDLSNVRRVVGDTANLVVAEHAAERSITLVRDSSGMVPLAHNPGTKPRVLSITISSRNDLAAGRTFDAALRRDSVVVRSEFVNAADPGTNYARLLTLADSADAVVVGSYLAGSYLSSSLALPDSISRFLHEIAARNPKTLVVAFGNPYLLQQLPEIRGYMVAWGGYPVSQLAAARAFLGLVPTDGKLPITIPPVAAFGDGLHRDARMSQGSVAAPTSH